MSTTDTTTTETEALILAGDGYQLTIAPEAFALRERALTKAANITEVTSHDESYIAGHRIKEMAALRNLVERSRKAVKEPVLEVGRRIDQAAKDFLADLNAEEGRIKQLIEGHAYRLAEERRIADEAERRAAAEARAARESAEAAQQAAQATGRIADVVAAQQAEQSRLEALAARCAAAEETHAAKQPDEVRWKWDFEVSDIRKLASIAPDLVRMEPAVIEIRRKITEAVEKHDDPALIAEIFAVVGITVFRKPEVRTR